MNSQRVIRDKLRSHRPSPAKAAERISRPGRAPKTPPQRMAGHSLARHKAKCAICHHPDRDAIEDDFIHWRSPREITVEFKLSHHSSLYRHARAIGLFARRKQNLRFILESLMERVEDVPVTANSVVHAFEAYACLTDDDHREGLPGLRQEEPGRWLRPPKRVIVTYETSAPSHSAQPETNKASRSDAPPVHPEQVHRERVTLRGSPDIATLIATHPYTIEEPTY